jgi:AcrR family transcriptional regulator
VVRPRVPGPGQMTGEAGRGLRSCTGGVGGVQTLPQLAGLLRGLRRREARERGGPELTSRELATRTGWSHTTIADYFAGKILPPTDRFDVLVGLLGATVAEQGGLAARDRVEELRRVEPAGVGSAGVGGPGWVVPRQLPAAARYFVGRVDQLRSLDHLAAEGAGAGVPIAAVDGSAGIGKTAPEGSVPGSSVEDPANTRLS